MKQKKKKKVEEICRMTEMKQFGLVNTESGGVTNECKKEKKNERKLQRTEMKLTW